MSCLDLHVRKASVVIERVFYRKEDDEEKCEEEKEVCTFEGL